MSEASRLGIFGRLGEKILGWVALALLLFGAYAIYQMPGETKQAIWSGIWRTTVWFALAAALPWSAQLFLARVLAAGTNWAGVALLAGMFAVDLLLAALLMSAWPSGFWSWAAAMAALAVVGTYNYLVVEYLADTSQP